MIHIIITVHNREIVFHKFQTKLTSEPERQIANVLNIYLTTWLRKKATEFRGRFRSV
jgi:hypothetical protein